MTKDEILNMPAGRELDALIAEKVIGEIVGPYRYYSIDISAAWKVVEKLKSDGFSFDMEIIVHGDPMGDYIVSGWRRDDMTTNFLARAETAPLTICRAALLTTIDT